MKTDDELQEEHDELVNELSIETMNHIQHFCIVEDIEFNNYLNKKYDIDNRIEMDLKINNDHIAYNLKKIINSENATMEERETAAHKLKNMHDKYNKTRRK